MYNVYKVSSTNPNTHIFIASFDNKADANMKADELFLAETTHSIGYTVELQCL